MFLPGLVLLSSLVPVQASLAQAREESPVAEETFMAEFDNVDIQALIEAVSRRTGKTFIVDPRVKATVNLVVSEPIDADKLYGMFLSILEVHGYAAVEAGAITKIVPSAVGTQSAIPLLDQRSDVADDLVSRVVHLQGASATEVVEVLRPLLPEAANISAESVSNSVVVTARAANIERLIELIDMMDRQQQ